MSEHAPMMTTYRMDKTVREMGDKQHTPEGRKEIGEMEQQWKQHLRSTLAADLPMSETDFIFSKAYEHNYGEGYYAVEETYSLLAHYNRMLTLSRQQ